MIGFVSDNQRTSLVAGSIGDFASSSGNLASPDGVASAPLSTSSAMHPPAKRMRLRRERDSQKSCIFANCHGCEECSLLPPNKQRVHTPPALRLTRTDKDEGIGDVVADDAGVKFSEERVDPSLQTRFPLSSHSQEELHAAQTTDVLGDAPRRQALEGSTDSPSSAAIPTCGAQPARVGPIALVLCEHPPYVRHSDALARDMSSSHGAHPANGESVSTATFSTGAAHSAAPDASSSADGTQAANRGSVFTATSLVSTDHVATLGSTAVVSATCCTVRARTQVGILMSLHHTLPTCHTQENSVVTSAALSAVSDCPAGLASLLCAYLVVCDLLLSSCFPASCILFLWSNLSVMTSFVSSLCLPFMPASVIPPTSPLLSDTC